MAAVLCIGLIASACASPRDKVAGELRDLGVGKRPAKCMANGLDSQLDKRDMKRLAKFLDGVDKSRRGGRIDNVVETIHDIGNPRIARVAVKAGIACTVLG